MRRHKIGIGVAFVGLAVTATWLVTLVVACSRLAAERGGWCASATLGDIAVAGGWFAAAGWVLGGCITLIGGTIISTNRFDV